MVVHWLRVRRAEVVNDAIRDTDVKSDNALPDVYLALEQGKSPRFVSDKVTERSNWRKSLPINAIGALVTFVVLAVFIFSKFMHGAWLVVVAIPILVALFLTIHRHYVSVARQLSMETFEGLLLPIKHTVIIPVSGVHRGVLAALQYARSISAERITAVYVDFDEEATSELRDRWNKLNIGVPLTVLRSPYRELTRPLLRYISRIRRINNGGVVTVVLPEFVPKRWWQHLLHNQSSLLLKGALLFREGVIVTNVPYHLKN
jgi:hypothetical protein